MTHPAQIATELQQRNADGLVDWEVRWLWYARGGRFPDLRSDEQSDAAVALEWRRRVAVQWMTRQYLAVRGLY